MTADQKLQAWSIFAQYQQKLANAIEEIADPTDIDGTVKDYEELLQYIKNFY